VLMGYGRDDTGRARCGGRAFDAGDRRADHRGGAADGCLAKRETPMSNVASTHRDLWPGIDLKLENARFHFEGMGQALQPPQQTIYTVVLESSGALIGGNWHRAFYAHLDAFLPAAWSVLELIRCWFGADNHPDEQNPRRVSRRLSPLSDPLGNIGTKNDLFV
jgi:hypothetical protein